MICELFLTASICICTNFSVQIESILVSCEFAKPEENHIDVRLLFKNTSEDVIFFFVPKNTDQIRTSDTLLNLDIGSSFITDPLAFPKYEVTLRPIFPGETCEVNRVYSKPVYNVKEVYIGFDYIHYNKSSGKLKRRLKRMIKRKNVGSVNLIDYYKYQDRFGSQYGKFVEC